MDPKMLEAWQRPAISFCFCAFTSLRYSDMASIKRTDIIGDAMYITTRKTHG